MAWRPELPNLVELRGDEDAARGEWLEHFTGQRPGTIYKQKSFQKCYSMKEQL